VASILIIARMLGSCMLLPYLDHGLHDGHASIAVRGKYESTCATFSQIRQLPNIMKSEYSVLKDTLINAYQRFEDQKLSTQTLPTQLNPIVSGYGNCPVVVLVSVGQ
jgi:hypothetical protein